MALCFAFGLGGAAHMLAFSTPADVVAPTNIGTSAAIVNGLMFLDLAQFAAWPLVAALAVAVMTARLMKETYPRTSAQS